MRIAPYFVCVCRNCLDHVSNIIMNIAQLTWAKKKKKDIRLMISSHSRKWNLAVLVTSLLTGLGPPNLLRCKFLHLSDSLSGVYWLNLSCTTSQTWADKNILLTSSVSPTKLLKRCNSTEIWIFWFFSPSHSHLYFALIMYNPSL